MNQYKNENVLGKNFKKFINFIASLKVISVRTISPTNCNRYENCIFVVSCKSKKSFNLLRRNFVGMSKSTICDESQLISYLQLDFMNICSYCRGEACCFRKMNNFRRTLVDGIIKVKIIMLKGQLTFFSRIPYHLL